MKRIQRVEQLILQWTTEELDIASLHPHEPQGCTAEWTGEQLGIDRSNASRDLNALVTQHTVLKIGGKPVLFLSVEGLSQLIGAAGVQELLQGGAEFSAWAIFCERLNDLLPTGSKGTASSPSRPAAAQTVSAQTAFDVLEGRSRSLKKPIELAKAAILYPPDGLHTLLTGPTGVGKTLFAESMHRFAVETGRLDFQAPFVPFNCADYSNNPQLLLSQLFGVEKGAYTGADRERAGMVEKADGGILFLDEVHRLPPEGQEMLFQLLDRGMYRRLGESDTHRRAKIRLIAATTENVQSSLLMTFVRRIPMLIPIPSLVERTLDERFHLISYLFAEESARVQRPFWIAPEVLKALLLFDCPANVGQLKSEIQLLSARAFLAQIQEEGAAHLNMTLESASDHVREGMLRITGRREELEELLESVPKGLVVNGDDVSVERREDENLYAILERQALELRRRGLNEEEINNVLSLDIDMYFRKFLQRVSRQFESRRQDIARLVGDSFLETLEEMFDLASRELERVLSSQTVFGTALHLRAAVDRVLAGQTIPNPGLAGLRAEAPPEYETAERMALLFSERTGILLPESEVGFLCTILLSTLEAPSAPKVGVLVIMHGSSTASSMLQTTQHLLGTRHGAAIDMPLHMEREVITEQAIVLARKIDEGKGIILLVDMGVLTEIGPQIEQRTGIPVRTIPHVTTYLVMQAVRKAALSPASLEAVYATVLQGSTVYLPDTKRSHPLRSGVLPVVCVTGQGSAVQLKAILEERLRLPEDYELDIVPVSITSFEETLERLHKMLGGAKPVAIVGTLDPMKKGRGTSLEPLLDGVPFISAQEVLLGDGMQRLSRLIGVAEASGEWQTPAENGESSGTDRMLETFRASLKRVNPYFVLPLIEQALDRLVDAFPAAADFDVRIGMTMHLMMALERRLQNGRWPTEEREPLPLPPVFADRVEEVAAAFAELAAELELEIPACESGHLLHLLLQEELLNETAAGSTQEEES
jgi:transcriptional regulator with AAA-type ATPase domain/transcriptional regulatory protein LevR